jgi:hypothetical protein
MSRRAYRVLPTAGRTFHPRLLGTRGAVASNSNLSANAGEPNRVRIDPRGSKSECFPSFAIAW